MRWELKGKVIGVVYRAVTYALTPLIFLHVSVRRLRGLEHPTRWTERFGYPSSLRPDGPLLWFHAVSLGTHWCSGYVCVCARESLVVVAHRLVVSR